MNSPSYSDIIVFLTLRKLQTKGRLNAFIRVAKLASILYNAICIYCKYNLLSWYDS